MGGCKCYTLRDIEWIDRYGRRGGYIQRAEQLVLVSAGQKTAHGFG